jgi:hypothetical protein
MNKLLKLAQNLQNEGVSPDMAMSLARSMMSRSGFIDKKTGDLIKKPKKKKKYARSENP